MSFDLNIGDLYYPALRRFNDQVQSTLLAMRYVKIITAEVSQIGISIPGVCKGSSSLGLLLAKADRPIS